MTGQKLSHYQINAELGRGGMGVVYRATDTKLNRTVALKLLASHMLGSTADKSRFYREARAAAALHHPHIATVFEIDETDDGRPFIAMEYVEGRQLDEALEEKPLPVERAVQIAMQVAEALRVAHEREIVHRDIKSANVMLTREGTAKVLDFGLAKTNASTKLTQMGSTVGTVAYMSPEQARGEEVDHRTDLWSLGAVLYEMLTGRLPFPGSYEQAVVYGILNAEPEPVTSLRTGVPMQLEWAIEKLLAKDREHRYQTAGDLLADLKSLDLSGSGQSRRSVPAYAGTAAGPGKATPPIWIWGAMAGALVVGVLAGRLLYASENAPAPVYRFSLTLPDDQEFTALSRTNIAISPDGLQMAYEANNRIFVRPMSDPEAFRSLPGTEGGGNPVFSPDGRWVAFHRGTEIQKVQVDGGSIIRLWEAPNQVLGLRWTESDVLTAGLAEDGMAMLDADGGSAEVLAPTLEGRRHYGPQLLPGGRRILYGLLAEDEERSEIRVRDLVTGKEDLLRTGGRDARYMPSGHIFYVRNGSLFAMNYDPWTGRTEHAPVLVEEKVRGTWGNTGAAQWAVSTNGTLVKIPGMDSRWVPTRLRLLGLDGTSTDLTDGTRRFMGNPAFSPDGTSLAVLEDLGDTRDVWVFDAASGQGSRLASEDGRINNLAWSPDGRRVAFAVTTDSERWSIVLARTPGSPAIADSLLGPIVKRTRVTSWLGETVLIEDWTDDCCRIEQLEVATGAITPLSATGLARNGRLAPDGRWIAYEALDGGSTQIFATLYPDGGSRIPVSGAGGVEPRWGANGSQVFYVMPDQTVRSVSFNGATGAVGPEVTHTPERTVESGVGYDVSPDGRQLAVLTWDNDVVNSMIEVVVNWSTVFEERMQEAQEK